MGPPERATVYILFCIRDSSLSRNSYPWGNLRQTPVPSRGESLAPLKTDCSVQTGPALPLFGASSTLQSGRVFCPVTREALGPRLTKISQNSLLDWGLVLAQFFIQLIPCPGGLRPTLASWVFSRTQGEDKGHIGTKADEKDQVGSIDAATSDQIFLDSPYFAGSGRTAFKRTGAALSPRPQQSCLARRRHCWAACWIGAWTAALAMKETRRVKERRRVTVSGDGGMDCADGM